MDADTLKAHLDHEYGLLAAALAEASPEAPVPSCPGWTVTDLKAHLAMVYLHKVETMRLGKFPDPWPPETPLPLAEAYLAMQEEFAGRQPEDRSMTWFGPDQTVGFWIRRMAQETSIHRVDAELAAAGPITPIAPDLAVDGIDEVLGFLEFGYASWPDDFAGVLGHADPRPVRIETSDRAWTVTAAPEGLTIETAPAGMPDAAATVTGSAGDICRWLWNRGGEVSIAGDQNLAEQLHQVMATVMQ
jgi:uncharacterized protein (TIGR03083 family)